MAATATATPPRTTAPSPDGSSARAPSRKIKDPRSDRVLNTVMIVVLVLFSLTIVYPFIYIISASVSEPTAVSSGKMWLWPVDFSTDAYRAVFDYPAIPRGFANSILYTALALLIGTAATLGAGYALSRADLAGRNLFSFVFVLTMMISGGMIPMYLVVKQLHMMNTMWAVILPGAVSVWQLIVTRTFFQTTIPLELLECARIDGANDFRFFFTIALPLAKPIIAVNMLLYGVGTWNQYFNALIYLTDEHLYPLQLVMRNIMITNSADPSNQASLDPARAAELKRIADQLKYALIIIASLPPLIAYPFVQKHFVKGMMIGSLKG